MVWKAATPGEAVFIAIHRETGKTVNVVSEGYQIDEYPNGLALLELFQLKTSLHIFLRCMGIARYEHETNKNATSDTYGKRIWAELNILAQLSRSKRFCADLEDAARIANESKRDSALARQLVQGDGDHCYICGVRLKKNVPDDQHDRFTADHLWPLAFCGPTKKENLVPCCRSCNRKRDDLLLWPSGPTGRTIWMASDDKNPPAEVVISLALARLIDHISAVSESITLKEGALRFQPLRPGIPRDNRRWYVYLELLQHARMRT